MSSALKQEKKANSESQSESSLKNLLTLPEVHKSQSAPSLLPKVETRAIWVVQAEAMSLQEAIVCVRKFNGKTEQPGIFVEELFKRFGPHKSFISTVEKNNFLVDRYSVLLNKYKEVPSSNSSSEQSSRKGSAALTPGAFFNQASEGTVLTIAPSSISSSAPGLAGGNQQDA